MFVGTVVCIVFSLAARLCCGSPAPEVTEKTVHDLKAERLRLISQTCQDEQATYCHGLG